MDQPSTTIRVLFPRPHPTSEGGLEDISSYDRNEVRNVIRLWHYLPSNLAQKLDIVRVYPWLGKEFQDVFDLYALGYQLDDIAAYWAKTHPTRTQAIKKDYGDRVIGKLIQRIQWLLSFESRPPEEVLAETCPNLADERVAI